MIRADFFGSSDDILGFRIKGHSGSAESGYDIICASVSSAAYMAVNTITDVALIEPEILIADDGYMELRLESKSAVRVQIILRGLYLHLDQLSKQYSKYLNVKFSEV